MALNFGLKPQAVKALFLIADFVEQQNTLESGQRFIEKFLALIEKEAAVYKHIKLCNYPGFAKRNLKCIFIDRWVITLGLTNNKVVVHHIIHGSRLKY